jgi:hypothetical protein
MPLNNFSSIVVDRAGAGDAADRLGTGKTELAKMTPANTKRRQLDAIIRLRCKGCASHQLELREAMVRFSRYVAASNAAPRHG